MEDNNEVKTETVVVNGHTVDVQKDGNEFIVTLPEGLSEEEINSIKKGLSDTSKLMGTYHRKLQMLKSEKDGIDKIKREMSEENTLPPVVKPLWEELGMNSESELEDYAADYPGKFAKAVYDHAQKIARAEVQTEISSTLQKQAIEAEIIRSGHDPQEVYAYMKFYGITDPQKGLQLYARNMADKSDPVLAAQIEAQRQQVKYVSGSDRPILRGQYDKATLESLSDEQLEQAKNEVMRRARR